jgi:HPr kinase/phosphorylase
MGPGGGAPPPDGGSPARPRRLGDGHEDPLPRALPLATLADLMGLMQVAAGHLDLTTITVTTSEVNRPGLQLTGYTEHFNSKRLDDYFALGFPALVVARGLHVMPDMVAAADRHDVPVFATDVLTSEFAGRLNWLLIHALAPRSVIAGGLVDVYGEGVLITRESGVGASETALELVRRGHRLIADDRVEVSRINADHLRGRVPQGQRHLIDIPGVGEIDVEELFGMGAIKPDARVTLVVSLEVRDLAKEYERVGLTDTLVDVFGVELPHVTIPVQPGRNLAVIIEAAALNHRMRALGYNAAADLLGR